MSTTVHASDTNGKVLASIIGQRLKELRKEMGFSAEKAAVDNCLSRSALVNYEKGKRLPDMGCLLRLSHYYNVSIIYLIGETDARKPKER